MTRRTTSSSRGNNSSAFHKGSGGALQQGTHVDAKPRGRSNYQAGEVVHIYHVCRAKGWVLPTIYQGMYNASGPS